MRTRSPVRSAIECLLRVQSVLKVVVHVLGDRELVALVEDLHRVGILVLVGLLRLLLLLLLRVRDLHRALLLAREVGHHRVVHVATLLALIKFRLDDVAQERAYLQAQTEG